MFLCVYHSVPSLCYIYIHIYIYMIVKPVGSVASGRVQWLRARSDKKKMSMRRYKLSRLLADREAHLKSDWKKNPVRQSTRRTLVALFSAVTALFTCQLKIVEIGKRGVVWEVGNFEVSLGDE